MLLMAKIRLNWPHICILAVVLVVLSTVAYYHHIPDVLVLHGSATAFNHRCRIHNCLDIYQCPMHGDALVYIYPWTTYVEDGDGPVVNPPPSVEFVQLVAALRRDNFTTDDPNSACLFLPPVDLLDSRRIDPQKVGQLLANLPYWNTGKNHVLLNIIPGEQQIPSGDAILAASVFPDSAYRHEFDVVMPALSPTNLETETHARIHRLVAPFRTDNKEIIDAVDFVLGNCIQSQSGCTVTTYQQLISSSVFCLVLRQGFLGHAMLTDLLAAGCVPVIIPNNHRLPYDDVLQWSRVAVLSDIHSLATVLESCSNDDVSAMKTLGHKWYLGYFSSIDRIVTTAFGMIRNRIYPHKSPGKESFNVVELPNHKSWLYSHIRYNGGFTAVILTYDRFATLCKTIEKVALIPSLAKVIVIWNNPDTSPPPSHLWPKLEAPMTLIRTSENKLSNRFYPHPEIQTECVLSLDDDINMLTVDELEFGYQTWLEFPDRIVGYPGRLHYWNDTDGSWKYESEWMNDISIVLTGASFYHTHYHHLYTYDLRQSIKWWVDKHINCEDIAFNFLVASVTKKPPLKVTPRKKFKSDTNSANNLSNTEAYMSERSACIQHFAGVYGHMPLVTAGFRVDPVLYETDAPRSYLRYKDIDSL